MSNAQKNYLKKWAVALGVIFGIVLMILCFVLGNPWDLIVTAIFCLGGLALIVVMVAEIIGSTIWHWRLMGECKTEWEEEMLAYWWRFMNYCGGDWEGLIPRMIEEDTDEELGIERKYQMELFERFKAVKAPRILKW